jgi:hypothetical protein
MKTFKYFELLENHVETRFSHCEERSDAAIPLRKDLKIASLRSQ